MTADTSYRYLPIQVLGRWFVFFCLVAGCLARWIAWFFFVEQFGADLGDQLRYLGEARSLLETGTFSLAPGGSPTALDGPIYAVFLAGFMKLFQSHYPVFVFFAQSLISMFTGWVLAQMAWMATRNLVAARISLLWWTLYPFAVFYSGLILTETLYAFFLVFMVWVAMLYMQNLSVKPAVLLGLVSGVTSLFRATVNGIIPFLFLSFFLACKNKKVTVFKHLCFAGITMLLVISPWVIRNYLVFGKVLPGSTQAGRMLYLANNPINETGFVVIPRDAQPPEQKSEENELEYNERLEALAWEFIQENPGHFMRLCFYRSYQFWRPFPKFDEFLSVKIVVLSLGSLLPLYILFLWGLYLQRHNLKGFYPLLAVILATYAMHLVLGVSIRYRFPIEPLLVPAAAYGLYWLLGKTAILEKCHLTDGMGTPQ